MSRLFWKRFIGSLVVAFFSLQLTRLVFYLNLKDYFEAPLSNLTSAFLLGFEFDAVCIAYILGLYFLALPFLNSSRSVAIAKWFFVFATGVMNLLNCIDAEFFKFIARRSTDDLFEFAFLSDDIFNLAPNLIGTFWYLLVAFIVIMIFTYIAIENVLQFNHSEPASCVQRIVSLLPIAAVLVVFARGGFHPIPLSIIDASKIDSPNLNSVVLSTPFTIIKTLGKPELVEFEFESDEVAELSPIVKTHSSKHFGSLKGSNVVVLIVESLASEYVGSLNNLDVGYTPFIDSLAQHALVFENAYANGHRSIEGIAAIAASIPTLMYEPFTTSRYAENNINSLANLLKQEGYYASFMHGGNKNSMNFESFSSQAEYDEFYDRDDYPFPDEHYDGIWGISDHYMLKQCVEEYNQYEKPFFSTIFTLSSHHPYTIPEAYQNRFPNGTLPIHESIGYTDESLREFFQEASKTDWFKNTLFVLTADHTSLSEHQQYQTKLGSLRIPIIYYHPSDSLLIGRTNEVTQQADIMPTILDLVGFDNPYLAFGTSVFDSTRTGAAVAFKHDQYQLLRNNQLVCFDGENVNFAYDLQNDALLQHNVVSSADIEPNVAYLKAFIQNYSFALNNNKMTSKTWSADTK